MANFFIRRITAIGKDKTDAVVEFTNGLNIICGLSDTGKSCILLCIDYIFGSKQQPFDKSTGYTEVSMLIDTSNGFVELRRKIGRNIIIVESANERIRSGEYDREYNEDTGRDGINTVLLKLIGINEVHRILYSKDFVKKRLTWRTFSHMFIINEDYVHTKKPILIIKSKANLARRSPQA
jgi:hypothetical protein